MYGTAFEIFGIDNNKPAVELIKEEVERVGRALPPLASPHEGYAVLLEGLDNLKRHVFTKYNQRDLDAMRIAAIAVATIAARMADEVCRK